MKAPKYFLDLIKKSDETEKDLAKLLGVSRKWIIQQRKNKKGSDAVVEKLGNDPKKSEHFMRLLDVGTSYKDVAWAEFRLANCDNKFGQADVLTLDKTKKTISIGKRSINRNWPSALRDLLSI